MGSGFGSGFSEQQPDSAELAALTTYYLLLATYYLLQPDSAELAALTTIYYLLATYYVLQAYRAELAARCCEVQRAACSR